MKKQFLEAGKIVGTKGLKGELMVECWCDKPEIISNQKTIYMNSEHEKYNVIKARTHKKSAIILLENIDSIEEADKYRGKIIYIDRNSIELKNGQYFIQDLLGIKVYDSDTNKEYGKITDVFKTGANDVYQITDDNGINYLIPVIDDVIIKMDLNKEILIIKPLKGIFDNEV